MSRQIALVVAIALYWTHSALADPPDTAPRSEGLHECQGDVVSSETLQQLVTALRIQKQAVERRERDIEQREAVANEITDDAKKVLAEIEAIRDSIEKRLGASDEESDTRIKRLAKVYAEMPPNRAAQLLEELDLNLATALISKMKHKNSAALLALMSRKNALRMSKLAAQPLEGALAATPKGQPRREP